MPGLVFDGAQVQVAGAPVVNYLDDPKLRLDAGDCRRRRLGTWVRSVIVHTTIGESPVLRPGVGPDLKGDVKAIDIWRSDPAHSGAHLVIDCDGSVVCAADLVLDAAYHATTVNEVSIGIELKQSRQLEIWEKQLEVLVSVIDAITRHEHHSMAIQRQLHFPYVGPISRLAAGGQDCVGVFGHRDQTSTRDAGDPGDQAMQALLHAGYESYAFHKRADLVTWRKRQLLLRNENLLFGGLADGVPGRYTRDALIASGKKHGLWVSRPGD